MASFGPVAPHYDALMARVPYDSWFDYYKLLLLQQEIWPKTYLDVCCGTGTIAEMLASEGKQVLGIDLSEGMIAAAGAKAARKGLAIDYRVADASDFSIETPCDAAYSFFDSLNYIADLDAFRAAIACVGRAVRPGGSFIFDLNTAYAFETSLFDQQDLRPKTPVRYLWTGSYDPSSRVIRVDMQFWTNEGEFKEVHVQRAHSDEEVKSALTDAGFEHIRVFNSYTLDPPRKRSDRVHYCSLKCV